MIEDISVFAERPFFQGKGTMTALFLRCVMNNVDLVPLTLLHSEKAKIEYNFGLSECNRV